MDDTEAVARLKRGDIGGLEALVRRYHTQALQSAYMVVGNWAQAEDITQAAFVNAYERIATFDSARPFKPWFLRSVVYSALKVAGGRRDVPFDAQEGNGYLEIPSPEPGLIEMLERAETREEVLAAIEQLTPAQRATVVMKYYLDMSDAEVSQQLSVPQGTVRRRLHDARKRLRKLLAVS